MSDFREIRQKLDQVSASFCLAKWKQVTIYLQSGSTHSCHHPDPHTVPLEEVRANPDALHNSRFKMLRRKEMLEGRRPDECHYCWKIEDVSTDLMSDRFLKSGENWALPSFEEVRKHPWDWRVAPSYLEVSFSRTCNFKCAYCNPHLSSKWAEEIREHGPYFGPYHRVVDAADELQDDETNPYMDAFWKWWPEVYPSLQVFRISGGEPLLSKDAWRALDYVSAHPNPGLDIALNTNLGAPKKLIERLIERAGDLISSGKVKSFQIYASVDTWGEQAEYIRTGLVFDEFWKNVRELLERLPELKLGLMCAFNAMSVPEFGKLLEAVLGLKREFTDPNGVSRLTIDLPYVTQPPFLSVKILPPVFEMKLREGLVLMEQARGPSGFNSDEIEKMRRLLEWFRKPENPQWVQARRKEFFHFIAEYDRRRKVDFRRTFPELADFFGNQSTAAATGIV